ncbi:MAG: hypothetical protein KGQ79_08500 [Proteobacteria bacterium]|nr:hypothetical protein [Pseudomonadota bacterium]
MSGTGDNHQDAEKTPQAVQDPAPIALPTPEPKPAKPEPPPLPEPRAEKPRRATWPIWFGLGFLILAGGEAYLFVQQRAHEADKTELAVLQTQVADMRAAASQTAPVASLITAQADATQKLAMLAAQVNAMQGQVASDHGELAAMQASTQDIGKLTARMARLNAVAAASMALAAGEPLGVVPNAPPALAVFADTAPATMAQLRESFPAAARNAEAASLANGGHAGLWANVKLRLEGLITISNGEHVIFGPPAAAALNRMRAALANDDLAAAVAAADTLSPPAQAAMASWLTPARQLLAARQALAGLARQGQ